MVGYHRGAYHPWKSLPSVDGRPLSMDGRIHEWDATYVNSEVTPSSLLHLNLPRSYVGTHCDLLTSQRYVAPVVMDI